MKSQYLEDLYISVNQYFPNEESMMFQNYIEVKDSKGKIDQYIALFTDDKKFVDMIQYTLQLTFKKLPFVEFWCRIKEEYHQLSEKAIKIFLPLQIHIHLCEGRFSSYTLTKTTYRNRLSVEVNTRIQLSSIKPNIKDMGKKKM